MGARARTVYALTESGEQALHAWLASDEELVYEVRDEGMLKLFFSEPEHELSEVSAAATIASNIARSSALCFSGR